jgi:hypothetical protein
MTAISPVLSGSLKLSRWFALRNIKDVTGKENRFSDNSSTADPGSQRAADPFLGVFNLPSAGTYYVAVAADPNAPNALSSATIGLVPLTRPDGETGGFEVTGAAIGDSSFAANGTEIGDSGYRLHLSISPTGTPVPEPGSMALLAGLASVGGIFLKQRRRQ